MARIASLYIPWLGIVIENIGRLDYRKRIVNKTLKRPINLSSQRYFSKTIFVYFYHITCIITILYFLNFRPGHTKDVTPRMSLNLRDSTYFAAIASHCEFFF